MSRDTISFWIRSVVSHVCGSASEEDCRSIRIKLHQVKRIMTFVAVQEEQCNPASIESWNLVISEHLLSLLSSRCCPQACGYLFHCPHGGGPKRLCTSLALLAQVL